MFEHQGLLADLENRLLGKVCGRLEELARLGENWDSYGGLPPTEVALAAARDFIRDIVHEFAPALGWKVDPFVVAPLSDGGVQIEWRTPRREIELEVGPRGEIGYLLIDRSSEAPQFEEKDDVTRRVALALVGTVLASGSKD